MNYLEMAGCAIGLLYLWLEYKASIYLWPVSIVMPAIYIFIYYRAGLYADFGINLYFLMASAYGWIMWKRTQKVKSSEAKDPYEDITHFPMKALAGATLAFASCFGAIGWTLIHFTDSTVPWLDSFTTAASIIAMWMLARKYAEQWLVWLVVDITSSGLYIYKSLYFTAALYLLYALIAIAGYRKWARHATVRA